MQGKRRAWPRTVAIVGVLAAAACGAETAVFLIAIANSWSVERQFDVPPGLRYQLALAPGEPSGKSSKANIVGSEFMDDTGDLSAPLSGRYDGRKIEYTVSRVFRDDPDCPLTTKSCDPVDVDHFDASCCGPVAFSGEFVDEDHIHVKSASGDEDYWLYKSR